MKIYSVILPAYKEAENLNFLIEKIFKLAKNNIEILVVDDFSNDGTINILKKKKKKYKNLNYIIRYKDKSLALSILAGIQKSKNNNLIVMDCDFNHNPKDILKLIKLYEKKKLNFVIGSRFKNIKFKNLKFRYILSYFYCLFLSKFLGYNVKDSLSGFFIINKNVLNNLNLKKIFFGYGDYFFRLIFYLNKNKINFNETHINYGNRTYGVSKTNFLRVFFKYTIQAIKLKIND